MANAFQNYLKETQNELHHVAWPTREQTIIYTVLVAIISIGLAFYLGLFDFIFTTGLTHAINASTSAAPNAPEVIISTSSPASSTAADTATDTSASSDFKLDNLRGKSQ